MKSNRITEPLKNTAVHHTGWGFENDQNYPCDVLITSGKYLDSFSHRVSNFWYWQRILSDGSLAPEEHGYGSFETPKREYEIEFTIKVKVL
jgi:hypothetical protein